MEQIVPREKWLYNDRGMLKWMGWLLSDHSAFMEKSRTQETDKEIKPQMDQQQISRNLASAWEDGAMISIQMNTIEVNSFIPEIKGQVIGFNAGQIYVLLEEGTTRRLQVEDIRYATTVPSQKWWLDDNTL
ncbi:DNA-directed RNA polymerase subunit beta [Companilactobacillus furfuricola]|uniref:DNA-directed RNA polymerase subunit beta n=1 Tax=Companilactobacillus furfuricola TaxID=1462575 RepID=UPI000F799600|nr:DNA-directed RNA polymerase subunit beta [Companilactobacillus furfuricola]